MKKIVSLVLVLILALTGALAVNAEGIRDIFGTKPKDVLTPRGDTLIDDNHGIHTAIVDYNAYIDDEVFASHNFPSNDSTLSYSLDSNGFPHAKAGISDNRSLNIQELWDPNSPHTRLGANSVTYAQDDIGSVLIFDSDTNLYHINSSQQRVTYNSSTEKFSYTSGSSQFLTSSFGSYFALSIRTNFIMPEGGMLEYTVNNTPTSEAMRFSFSGDDLIYVYIDGVRVLNGSVNDESTTKNNSSNHLPSIDFSTGQVYTMTQKNRCTATTLKAQFEAYCDEMGMTTQETEDFINSKFVEYPLNSGNYILNRGYHSFAMFYAETASIDSVCKLSFNLLADTSYIPDFIPETTYDLIFVDSQYSSFDANGNLSVGNSLTSTYIAGIREYSSHTIELTEDVLDYNGVDYDGQNTTYYHDYYGDDPYEVVYAPGYDVNVPISLMFEEKVNIPFAGWFSDQQAAVSGYSKNGTVQHVDTKYAYQHEVVLPGCTPTDIDVYVPGVGDITMYDVIVFYAGWVPEVAQAKASADVNNYGGQVEAFNLAGVQIRSKDLEDTYQEANRNKYSDAMRFVTSYSLDFLNELRSLSTANGGTAYTPHYGYFVAADQYSNPYFPSGIWSYIKMNSVFADPLTFGGWKIYDYDCTKSVNDQNHHYFNGKYLLSTLVIKYEDDQQYYNGVEDYEAHDKEYYDFIKNAKVEARAYVKYTDANGNERFNLDTYGKKSADYSTASGETTFLGGCRASFNEVLTAIGTSDTAFDKE